MAFNKVFIILAIASYALAMPVLPVDEAGADSTSASVTMKIEDTTATVTTVSTADEVGTTVDNDADDSTAKSSKIPEELLEQDIAKRSVADEADSSSDDLETAAGTNVLRPLFVYRQQVAYRQRVRNSNNRFRGNRRF